MLVFCSGLIDLRPTYHSSISYIGSASTVVQPDYHFFLKRAYLFLFMNQVFPNTSLQTKNPLIALCVTWLIWGFQVSPHSIIWLINHKNVSSIVVEGARFIFYLQMNSITEVFVGFIVKAVCLHQSIMSTKSIFKILESINWCIKHSKNLPKFYKTVFVKHYN